MKVLGISGSMREKSYTSVAVRTALQGAEAAGAATEYLDLRDFPLPLVEVVAPDADSPERAQAFRKAVREADAVIIGTPEYHGGMSGSLKNALDWLTKTELKDKFVGLVGVSGGALGANEAMNQVRTTLRALHALTIPDQAGVPAAWKSVGKSHQVEEQEIADRLQRVGAQLVHYAALSSHALPVENNGAMGSAA